MDDDHGSMRLDDDYVLSPELTPEQNLWAAVTHRALMDARNHRMGNDGEPRNNHMQRAARKWFRERARTDDAGGWGWVVEALNMPPGVERRIFREAFVDRPIRLRKVSR